MSEEADDHLNYRKWMASTLVREIFGPEGNYKHWKNDLYQKPEEIEINASTTFESWDQYNKPHVEKNTQQEILKGESPSRRYGVGLLFPNDSELETEGNDQTDEQTAVDSANIGVPVGEEENELNIQEQRNKENLQDLRDQVTSAQDTGSVGDGSNSFSDNDEDALRLARIRSPRSMGITFASKVSAGPIRITVNGGRYKKRRVSIRNSDGKEPSTREIYIRVPVSGTQEFVVPPQDDFRIQRPIELQAVAPSDLSGLPNIQLSLDVRTRSPLGLNTKRDPDVRLITVTLVNRSDSRDRSNDDLTLFQSRFYIESCDSDEVVFQPLPNSKACNSKEEESLALLYRNRVSYCIGHGCAGDWEEREGRVYRVSAEPIPYCETPPLTPDLKFPNGHSKEGQKLAISMLPLAKGGENWIAPLNELAQIYKAWIDGIEEESRDLEEGYQKAAKRHVESARECHKRIKKGLEILENDIDAAYIFRLTNEAILLQQIAGRNTLNSAILDTSLKWERAYAAPTLDSPGANDRAWRPFQIAFILMSIPGIWERESADREIADLIWFPTGGGKTEAYLGASAFALLTRRFLDPDDSGTEVLMRYTLRLLTSQQFQRASGLICALESIRERERDKLGHNRYTIGIWVGGGTTPNSRKESLRSFSSSKKYGDNAYQHVMLKCPWCGAQMGPKKTAEGHEILGLRSTGTGTGRTAAIHCPDTRCRFHSDLPVTVVDEEIYDDPPSLIIGTVDKFAMLAWRPKAKRIFGLDENGKRTKSPPGLIIQDELHLITGPLGSVVGLYEGVIEELCTDKRNEEKAVPPKLIASTATTRASTEQIRDLYARSRTSIFPPPGIDSEDSFFATVDRLENGKTKPGRMYLGILARAFGSSLTVNVRVFSALLGACELIPKENKDAWRTLLVFYNSLRELGADLTLFGADIPERLYELRKRWNPSQPKRYLNNVIELTGRLSNSAVPKALEALEKKEGDKGAIDACLASNIIEVGVDVPRLSLMAVSGQPKNTAQYIQATGRVGRQAPGLVVMIYNNRKARDLSHYEHFKDYHNRLYAQVEPSSVTPFTTQVLERALHGAFLAWIRCHIDTLSDQDPRNFVLREETSGSVSMKSELKRFYKHYTARIDKLMKGDETNRVFCRGVLESIMKRKYSEWETWAKDNSIVTWENNSNDENDDDGPLLRRYGEPCRDKWRDYSWATPTSMRGVDSECKTRIVDAPIENLDDETSFF